MDEWIRSHVVQVPEETRNFCGDAMRDARMLDVGCGDMLADFGLLSCGPRYIEGVDIDPREENFLDGVAARVRNEGLEFPGDYGSRLRYNQYDGTVFPFEDESFDFVFSWSAFEHIADIGAVLHEMHRVLAPQGQAFVQVYPWFKSREGSHLTQWIKRPFFHLTETDRWVNAKLTEYVGKNIQVDDGFISKYMYKEYLIMNRISPSTFYEGARDSGFAITKSRLISHDEDLSQAPRGVDFADLMITGTMMLMRKGGSQTAVPRALQT